MKSNEIRIGAEDARANAGKHDRECLQKFIRAQPPNGLRLSGFGPPAQNLKYKYSSWRAEARWSRSLGAVSELFPEC